MRPVSEKAMEEFRKCVTIIYAEKDAPSVLDTFRYILSLPDRTEECRKEQEALDKVSGA